MARILGFDVSHHNGEIDWDKAFAAGYRKVFVKATEGVDYVDPRFTDNVLGAAAAGFEVGAYHFLRPDQDASAQAQHLLATVSPVRSKLAGGLALDVEASVDGEGNDRWSPLSQGIRVLKVSHFLAAADNAGYGRCVIYCSPGWWRGMFGASDFSGHPLWAASYSHEPNLVGTCWKEWAIWQSSESGTVPGVGAGSVDLDVWVQ